MSIHKRVNKRGTTWVVRYRDPVPRERTFERKADAERFERSVRHQLDTDAYLDPESARITVRDWSERWWPTIETSDRAPSTISGYESALRLQVLPHVGERRLRTLRRIDLEEWLGALRAAGCSNSTIHSARTVLGMVLASAFDARVIASNPILGIRLPTATSRTRNALSVEQVEALALTVDPGDLRAVADAMDVARNVRSSADRSGPVLFDSARGNRAEATSFDEVSHR